MGLGDAYPERVIAVDDCSRWRRTMTREFEGFGCNGNGERETSIRWYFFEPPVSDETKRLKGLLDRAVV